MQTRDHLALGYYLLDFAGSGELLKHRRAFLAGCVEPDCNMATYLRGMKFYRNFRGHNAENSLAHLAACIAGFQRDGLRTSWDYFTLGTVLHYAADAFTWPHNTFWDKSLVRHAAYERELHPVFSDKLLHGGAGQRRTEPRALLAFFTGSHTSYRAEAHEMATDCRYIIGVCESLLLGCLRYAEPASGQERIWKEAVSYANPYHHGLV